MNFAANVCLDDLTSFIQSKAQPNGVFNKFGWVILSDDEIDERGVRYSAPFRVYKVRLGRPATDKLVANDIVSTSNPSTVLSMFFDPDQDPKKEDVYSKPRMVYIINLDSLIPGARAGTLEFELDCGTKSNHLFDLVDKHWSFVVHPSDLVHVIGLPYVRTLLSREGQAYNRVVVHFVQALQLLGARPRIVITVTPSLKYYSSDQPTPPDPSWTARATCKVVEYVVSTSKPIQTFRHYHEEEVERGLVGS